MRRLLAAFGGAVLAASFLVAPAVSVQAAEDVSYLFVVDSADIRVTPLKGDAARVEITGHAVTRFTDRPEREAERIGVRGMLREFGWTRASKRLMDSTPNASISIAGERSQIVDIKRARVGDGRVVLRVVGINGPLESMRGAGSIFVDNAPTYPMTQIMEIYDQSGGPEAITTATVVLESATTATVTIKLSSIDDALPDRVVNYELGATVNENLSQGSLSVIVQISSSSGSDSAFFVVNLSIVDALGGEPLIGAGTTFFVW